MPTLVDLVRLAQRRLEAAGLSADDALRDASVLARFALGWDAAQWLSRQREPAPRDFDASFDRLIGRRATREPVAYVSGEREFYGRSFLVTRDVLIPRPETELLVEAAISALRSVPSAQRPVPTIVDVGTGSGCVAVTLALEMPRARIVATDTSTAALAVARDNARRHGVAAAIEFREGHLLAGATGPVDLIVSNPPYVPEVDRDSLAPEVRDFEPVTALFGGPDGLDVIRELVPAAAPALCPDGVPIMEFGFDQSDEVRRIVEAAGLSLVDLRADLQGIPRVAIASLSSSH